MTISSIHLSPCYLFEHFSKKTHAIWPVIYDPHPKISQMVALLSAHRCVITRSSLVTTGCLFLHQHNLGKRVIMLRRCFHPRFLICRSLGRCVKFIYSEKVTKFTKSPPIICPMYCQSNNWWRFPKILWPSQNI